MMKTFLLPALLGLSLSGIGIAIVYLSLRKDEDSHPNLHSSRQTIIEVKIPQEVVGTVIGRQGCNIKNIQEKSGSRINFKDEAGDSKFRVCIIRGTPESAQLAESLIHEIIMNQPLIISHEMWVPHRCCGRIIGRGGEVIRSIIRASCAKITVDSATSDPERHTQRRVIIKGTPEQISAAEALIHEKVEEEAELHRRLELSAANKSPRKTYESSKYLMANQEEEHEEFVNRTEHLQTSSNDGFLEVFVSAVEDPGQFWVQLVNQRGVELDQLEEKMTEFYKRAENRSAHVLKEWCVGDMIAAPFTHDDKWYRAKVLSTKLNEYDPEESSGEVYYVDYGDRCTLKLKEVCELRPDFLTLYFQAIECFLADVKPVGETWSIEATDTFEELADNALWRKKQALVRCLRNDPNNRRSRSGSPIPGIELHDFDKNLNIGQELVKRGLALQEEAEQDNNATVTSNQSSKVKKSSVADKLLSANQSDLPKSSEASTSKQTKSSTSNNDSSNAKQETRDESKLSSAVQEQNKPIEDLPAKAIDHIKKSSISTILAPTSLNGHTSTSGSKSKACPRFKPPTSVSKSSSRKVQENSTVNDQPTYVLPEPPSDEEDYYDEDDMGFSMG